MLDAYLPGMTGARNAPSDDVFSAVRALGVMDSTDVAALQGVSPSQRVQPADEGKRARNTSLARDTVERVKTDARQRLRHLRPRRVPRVDVPVPAKPRRAS